MSEALKRGARFYFLPWTEHQAIVEILRDALN